MMRYNLTALTAALLLTTLAELHAADTPLAFKDPEPRRYELAARASQIDSRAWPHPEIDFVFEKGGKPVDVEKASADTRVQPRGKLVIWLMGYSQPLFERLNSYGLHAIQVHYANGWFAKLSPSAPPTDSQFLGKIRLEAATGEDFSDAVAIPKPDGMMERALQFVKWLAKENPPGCWEYFLTDDRRGLRWDRVIVAGSSHGSTTAARFAKHQRVDRVVMFCGPRDQFETWQGLPSATPPNRFFAFSHVLDGGWTGHHYDRSWELLGLHQFGPTVNVDHASPPYGNTRRLITDADVKNDAGRAHSSVVPGGAAVKDASGHYLHEDVWRYLFTHPVEQVGDAVPPDPRVVGHLSGGCTPISASDRAGEPKAVDTFSDTWAATDALGRSVPTYPHVSPPRPDRTVGIFYFLWHGAHIQGGPFDVSRALASDPEALRKPDSPLWGPQHVMHHWGESIFGYYLTRDEGVLRKHAQMLGDAGVDVVIFDVTNQLTYRDDYLTLLKVWSEMRRLGNRTPQVAFLAPFGEPSKVVRELWHDLYQPNLYRDLWFRWDDRPLILADSEPIFDREESAAHDVAVELLPGQALGQSFTSGRPVRSVAGQFPTWRTTGSAVTLKLHRDGPGGTVIAEKRVRGVLDNQWLTLTPREPLPAGTYYIEASAAEGKIGWWSRKSGTFAKGQASADGQTIDGSFAMRLNFADGEADEIHNFFTFRKPQPDYFQGPLKADMWSWLEVYPQHVFRNSRGEKEQMSVGVAQNAVGGRLSALSEPGSLGRSYHDHATDRRSDAVLHGFNAAEQWTHALAEDPRFIFITGWNEWIASRFDKFAGNTTLPVVFVDECDEERSRDIEPMRGGHGDNYFYQMIANIRRYKGARPIPVVKPQPIRVDGRFDDWNAVEPEFRDTIGDAVDRQCRGWDPKVTYSDHSGRNDIVAAKVGYDRDRVYFYVRTQNPITPSTDPNWMLLFLDVDCNAATGWLGYDVLINASRSAAGETSVERNVGGRYQWQSVGSAEFRTTGNELELSCPWRLLGLEGPPASFDFKWADHIQQTGDWSDFTLHGDVAPNDRFNYRAVLAKPDGP